MHWIVFALGAALSWGLYGPSLHAGQTKLGSPFRALLCVGIAYFVIAVLFPLGMFLTRQAEWPDLKTTGLVFSGLAGVAGAIGALCVIFASRAGSSLANGSSFVTGGGSTTAIFTFSCALSGGFPPSVT